MPPRPDVDDLHEQLEDYLATGRWDEARDLHVRAAEATEDAGARVRHYRAAAALARERLSAPVEAGALLAKALDATPDDETLLREIGDTFRAYDDDLGWVKALKAVAEGPGARHPTLAIRAWDRLAEVYLTQFGNRDQGAEALERAAVTDPENATRHEILVELWMRKPPRPERALPHHRALFELDPTRLDSLRTVFEHLRRAVQVDAAWCCADALVFLGKREVDVLTLHERFKPKGPRLPSRALSQEEWRRGILRVQGQANTLSAVFSVLAPPVADLYKVDLRGRLSPDDRLDPATSPLAFVKRLAQAANALGLPVPETYRWRGGRGVDLLHAGTPVLLVGEDLLQGRDDAELLFLAARHLSYLRPECWLLRVLRTQLPTLRAVLLGSLQIAVPAIDLALDDARLVEPLRPKLERALPPAVRTAISHLLPRFRDFGVVNLPRYTATAEAAANRAGLVLTGSLAPAISALVKETPLSPTPIEDQAKALVGYATSPAYVDLRAGLGLSVGK